MRCADIQHRTTVPASGLVCCWSDRDRASPGVVEAAGGRSLQKLQNTSHYGISLLSASFNAVQTVILSVML